MFPTASLLGHCGTSDRPDVLGHAQLKASSTSARQLQENLGVPRPISARHCRHCCRRVMAALMTWLLAMLFLSCDAGQFQGIDWCHRDPGPVQYVDALGRRHYADISYTRDGSIWFRFTPEAPSDWAAEWTYADETQFQLKLDVVEPAVFGLLQSVATHSGGTDDLFNYTDYCALTDLQVVLRADRGWHPSYLTAFDPRSRETKTFVFRHNRDCDMSTRLRLDADGQRLVCEGGSGPRTACGRSGLPERGRSTGPLLLRAVNFDPMGPDKLLCNTTITAAVETLSGGAGGVWPGDDTFERDESGQHQQPRPPPPNSFTFQGTYYTVFVKVAACDRPQDSPSIGYEVTNRPNRDDTPNTILLTDPTQTILADSIIVGWRIFVKVHSVKHSIYLQVWRPVLHAASAVSTSLFTRPAASSSSHASSTSAFPSSTHRRSSPTIYNLIGQTFVSHERTHLRAVDVPLADLGQQIRVRRGDVLGLYFPDQNPIGWSTVPCADHEAQRYRLVTNPSNVVVGRTMRFDAAPPDDRSPCRHYSFIAFFANKSGVKQVDDWQCPSRDRLLPSDTLTEKGGRGMPPSPPARSPLSRKIKETDNVDGDIDGVDGDSVGGQLAINLLLITIGCLISLLVIVGLISYCRAVSS